MDDPKKTILCKALAEEVKRRENLGKEHAETLETIGKLDKQITTLQTKTAFYERRGMSTSQPS